MTLAPTPPANDSTSSAPTPAAAPPPVAPNSSNTDYDPELEEFHGMFGVEFADSRMQLVPRPDPTTPPTPEVVEPPQGKTTPESCIVINSTGENGEKIQQRPDLGLLFTILSYCRSHGSRGEEAFINEVLIPNLEKTPYEIVFKGPNHDKTLLNIVVEVPNTDNSKSKTMFSCHIDTMHAPYLQNVRQKLEIDPFKGYVHLANGLPGCLGADDGAGVWLMLQMIRFGKPGTYVFHRGEERGCKGSAWLADNHPEWLKEFDRAIAFDRKLTNSVITVQRGQRTCSNTFAEALARKLNSGPWKLHYEPDPTGMYTDTANYTKFISECTNVSVGYEDAHGPTESLQYTHIDQLLGACMNVDFESLPKARDVTVVSYSSSPDYHRGSYHRGGSYNGGSYNGGSYNGGSYNGSRSHWTASHNPPPPPAPAPAPAAAGGGKRNKKRKGQQAGSAAGFNASGAGELTHDMTSADIAELQYFELFEVIEGLDPESLALLVSALAEECEGLKARNGYLKRLLGYHP